ncbi:MAG TPA: hypothetical protein VFU49_04920 [Ktedonobacteraceae bacterium]|nr:hypothetical protein [Ktedonobacteraceae bacterium]
MNPAHRCRLRHCPEFAVEATGIRSSHVDGQVRQRPPEVHQRGAVVGTEALVAYVDRSVDDNIVRREAEACHGGVVANLKVEGIGT